MKGNIPLDKILERYISTPLPCFETLAIIKNADILIYSPGTLHSSLLPTYMVTGLADTIRKSRGLKFFVTNISTDKETYGYTACDFVKRTYNILNENSFIKTDPNSYFDYICANKPNGSEIKNNGNRLVPLDFNKINSLGVEVIKKDFHLKKSNDGLHDGEKVVRCIRQLKALKDIGYKYLNNRLIKEENRTIFLRDKEFASEIGTNQKMDKTVV